MLTKQIWAVFHVPPRAAESNEDDVANKISLNRFISRGSNSCSYIRFIGRIKNCQFLYQVILMHEYKTI